MSIKVSNITHIYSEGRPYQSVALDDVSFEVEDGQFVGIIGHTGSGKSTLVQHLNGLLSPKSGAISVGDMEITAPKVSKVDVRKRIGLVFQYPEYQLFEETVEKDVAFGPKNLGLSQEEISTAVKMGIELVGLDFEEIKDKSPFELSGGQKRRVAIAGVIAMNPEVLMLDEPTAGLDPKAHREVFRMIESLRKKMGTTIILVSHNMNDIAALCDKILVMEKGRLAMCGTPQEVFSREDELQRMGLDLPETALLAKALRAKGLDVAGNIFTIDDLESAVCRALGKSQNDGQGGESSDKSREYRRGKA